MNITTANILMTLVEPKSLDELKAHFGITELRHEDRLLVLLHRLQQKHQIKMIGNQYILGPGSGSVHDKPV